jgi:hypothetical protein
LRKSKLQEKTVMSLTELCRMLDRVSYGWREEISPNPVDAAMRLDLVEGDEDWLEGLDGLEDDETSLDLEF